MKPLSLKEIAAALGTSVPADAVIGNICTDTREITPGSLFIALKGERFDGHDFVPKAFESGAVAAVVEREVPAPGPLLLAEDTGKALLALGGWYRRLFPVRVVAVTGSVGKTSTKEMIDAVLSPSFRTLKTEGNLNNEIGLPKTLFRLDDSYEAAVIEMGMSGFGEISRLSRTAQGDVGVLTNIGVSHIENLGSREGIFRAKMEILDGLKEGAPLIVNGDDDLLRTVSLTDRPVLRYGIRSDAVDARAESIRTEGTGMRFEICHGGSRYPARVPALGEHHVLNALAAFLVGVRMGIAPERVVAALPGYRPSGMRQKFVDFHGITVIEDCYNASPDSMKASLSALALLDAGRRVAVLGDMLELGGYAETAHRQVGRSAGENRIDAVLCFGAQSEYLADEAKKAGVPFVRHFAEKGEIARWLKENLSEGDAVLFKASRGMRFEEIIEGFYAEE